MDKEWKACPGPTRGDTVRGLSLIGNLCIAIHRHDWPWRLWTSWPACHAGSHRRRLPTQRRRCRPDCALCERAVPGTRRAVDDDDAWTATDALTVDNVPHVWYQPCAASPVWSNTHTRTTWRYDVIVIIVIITVTTVTRLSSNLRKTTRECVHLVYTRRYFWSRD